MSDLVSVLILGLLLLALALALGWWRASRRAGRASRARNQRAQRGEADAERLLEEAGYEILDRQVTALWRMEVDGEEVEISVRADLWVGLGPQRFVAEVKTGARAPDPTLPATRRQLLEYLLAFEPDGLLLVDVEAGVVHAVAFPGAEALLNAASR